MVRHYITSTVLKMNFSLGENNINRAPRSLKVIWLAAAKSLTSSSAPPLEAQPADID